jgi:valyl-tRNA synthetase
VRASRAYRALAPTCPDGHKPIKPAEPRHFIRLPVQYERWEAADAFACNVDSAAEPYAIVIPPPNVTGSLHIGHAFNNTIQDILIRYHRMLGRDVLWQPGTDHAGIATQMVVERQLAEEGIVLDRGIPRGAENAKRIGREEFVEKVWEWREHSGGIILKQLRRLGATCDWSRERFTMDEGLSRAVLKVFVSLYKDGLIYRDKRLVNWDPKFHTAISDLEVEQRETKGHLWHFKYPIEGEEGRFVVVATTRPETMLGDTAVAVHPEDPRLKDLIGKHAILPLVGRRIPIVGDEHADPEQGSGAVKITPAHDFNDFEVGRRHDLEMINIFDDDAHINENAPEAYRSLDRFEARKRVVADIEAQGLLEKIEDHVHTVPHGDRSGVPVEPYLTDQWFADAETLAKPCIEAVEDGRTKFVPEQFARVYFQWMRNIQPWCISRQLWWGHQIPAWFGPDGEVFVEETEAEAQAAAGKHYGKPTTLTRETDVLDTWFSSALWPFSTLGWPDETPALKRYYPGNCLVTGEDIIFFWVARMMMFGMHFMRDEAGAGRVPFHDVYIHGLVRDAKGQKYSKSKGNVVDPLDLMDKFGADALRFTLASLAVQGRDIKLAESRIEGYRNFATKLWNASRYVEMNECAAAPTFAPELNKETVNRWIVDRVANVTNDVAAAIEGYRFNEAAAALYQFVWHEYCDWYVEFSKPILQDGSAEAQAETRATLIWVLDRILHLLHPFMPHVTEELWKRLGPDDARMLIVDDWPTVYEGLLDADAAAEIDWAIRLISDIRAVRAEMNVPPKAEIPLFHKDASETTRGWMETHGAIIRRLARLSETAVTDQIQKGAIQFVVGEATYGLPLADIIDLDQERARLKKEIDKLGDEIARLEKKLANENFVAKAPPEVVEEQKERRAEAETARGKLAEALDRIAAG